MIIPVHNEASRIARKIANTAALDYPPVLLRNPVRLRRIHRSHGRTHHPRAGAAEHGVIELPARRGKAAALNAGLRQARHDVLVFSDASIELEPGSLRRLVQQFQDPAIGCVSGEDRIGDGGGEGLVRSLRVAVAAAGIAGALDCRGQRLVLRAAAITLRAVRGGLAPDFLSVLRTVRPRVPRRQRIDGGRLDDQRQGSSARVHERKCGRSFAA